MYWDSISYCYALIVYIATADEVITALHGVVATGTRISTTLKVSGASNKTGFQGIPLGARCCVFRGRKNDEESKSCKTHC